MRELTDTDFINFVSSYDIVLLNETWISKNDNINLDIQGYTSEHLFGNKSTGTKKGRYSGESRSNIKNFLKEKIKIVEKNQIGIIVAKNFKRHFQFQSGCLYLYIISTPSRV